MPKSMTVGFEIAVINSCKYEFPKSRIIEYLFHFRQAILRKLKKYTQIVKIAFCYSVKTEDIGNALNFIKEKIQ
ncbi:hypothetical protein HZS_1330 [Henneguya salminicola]|nr:hypothetical protein HZS_1330 [Henneguya salminicola]